MSSVSDLKRTRWQWERLTKIREKNQTRKAFRGRMAGAMIKINLKMKPCSCAGPLRSHKLLSVFRGHRFSFSASPLRPQCLRESLRWTASLGSPRRQMNVWNRRLSNLDCRPFGGMFSKYPASSSILSEPTRTTDCAHGGFFGEKSNSADEPLRLTFDGFRAPPPAYRAQGGWCAAQMGLQRGEARWFLGLSPLVGTQG